MCGNTDTITHDKPGCEGKWSITNEEPSKWACLTSYEIQIKCIWQIDLVSLRRTLLFLFLHSHTMVPEVFLIFHRISRSCERAAKRRTLVAKQRERKTSGYFGLESHFHADARVRILPSFSPLRDSCSQLRGSLAPLPCGEISRKTSGTRVPFSVFLLHPLNFVMPTSARLKGNTCYWVFNKKKYFFRTI